MNKIGNKFLLSGDKLMPEMYLRQLGFTYSACVPFTENKERIQKFNETEYSLYIYQNELDKVCFQHEILKISLEGLLPIKYCVIKHLMLIKIQNSMVINMDFNGL